MIGKNPSNLGRNRTLLWRGEGRRLFGGGSWGEDMEVMMRKGGNLGIKIGKKEYLWSQKGRNK